MEVSHFAPPQRSIFSQEQPYTSGSSMFRGSNKTFVFDMNTIQNKLQQQSEIKTPSTKAF